MRVDRDFHAVFTEPFLAGGDAINTEPNINELNLSVGEWWYGEIVDELCAYQIKIENTPDGYVVTQGACGTEPCDVATGACLDPSPCGDCCDALENLEDCDINEIVSSDLDVEVDPDNCKKVTINIKDGVIPEVPDFCECNTTVNTVNPQSVLKFCEDGQPLCITFGNLCAYLSECTGGDGDVTNIINNYLDVSDVDANLCGMVIEGGVIQSVSPSWCDQFATDAELAAAISGIDSGVLSVVATFPVVNTGTSINPVIELNSIYAGNQSFFGGDLTTDKWGRVTSANIGTPWIDGISSGDTWIDVDGTIITHNPPSTISTTLDTGVQVDATGHVVGNAGGYRIARWSGDTTIPNTSYSLNISAAPGVGVINYTFDTPMPHNEYFISIRNQDGTDAGVGTTTRSSAGFTIPNTAGLISIFIHE